ncbi:Ig-like domain-containing protein [Sporosarcina sp. NPDC096371]|uniref:Ig-like domain-containing protein n=1 Tax=Sporosarcina sp. NPDC096371 TaxID=3364530 RepID=UPI00380F31F7
MAQQPKSYKKFVATAATASLVASALVAPIAANAAATFTDVPASYKDAVDYLVSKGANGLSATEFGISKEITRGDAAVLLAGALGVLDEKAPASGFTDVPARAATAVNSLKAAGIINGKTATSFGFGDNLKRGEVALIFAKAYKLTGDASKLAFTDVNDRYKDAVAALVEAKVTSGISATKFGTDNNIKRGDFAKFAFGLKDGVSTGAATTATASATNLKEVVVSFDGTVDKSTASEIANYSLTGSNDPVVDSVLVAEDAKSVTLTVKDVLTNQSEYKLSVNNVKTADKVLSVKDVAFKPLDNTVPTVSKVEALGNKTVRVSFSEPVKAAQTSNFQVDGKVAVGSIQTTGNSVILKLSSALTDGEHTLTAEGVQDYAGFKTVKADSTFSVVEDKEAPTVAAVVSASFEKVVLKFSEPVEQVFASNVYWMQGAAKKQASSVKALADDTFEFTFVDTNKLVYTTDLFVTNVKDYSGNVIAKDTKVEVSPVIDQTRPEVLSAGFVKDSENKKIVLKFSKSLDAETAKKAANYVIKDKDGKKVSISTNVDLSKDKEVTISLLTALKDNSEYTLTVNGVSDNTTLKNVMLPYTTTLNVKDITAPTLKTITRLNDTQLFVQFDEAMATSGDGSVVDESKYVITDVKEGKTLTPSSFNVTGDSKGVILSFSKTLPTVASGIKVKVQLVKDVAGNYLENLSSTVNVANPEATTIDTVKATATDKVEVTFTKALQSLNHNDFTVVGYEIAYSELSSDGKKATFTLKKDLNENVKDSDKKAVQLKVVSKPSSVDVLGEKIAEDIVNADIKDEINATVKDIVAVEDKAGNKIKITFNEDVKVADQAKTDFIVKDDNGKTVAVEAVAINGTNKNEVIVTLGKSVLVATISAKDARFVTDEAGNEIANIDEETVELGGNTQTPEEN